MGGPTYTSAPPGFLIVAHRELMDGHRWGLDGSGAPGYEPDSETPYSPFNLKALLYQAYLNGSPYASAAAYDPSSDFDELKTELDSVSTYINDLGSLENQWESIIDSIIAKADATFISDPGYADTLDAFNELQSTEDATSLALLINRFYLADCVDSDGLTMALSLQTRGNKARAATFAGQLLSQSRQERANFINEQTGRIANIEQIRLAAKQSMLAAFTEYYMKKVVAGKEFINEELDFAWKDTTYNMQLLQQGCQAVGSFNGAPNLIAAPSALQTALSTTLNLASIVSPLLMKLI